MKLTAQATKLAARATAGRKLLRAHQRALRARNELRAACQALGKEDALSGYLEAARIVVNHTLDLIERGLWLTRVWS